MSENTVSRTALTHVSLIALTKMLRASVSAQRHSIRLVSAPVTVSSKFAGKAARANNDLVFDVWACRAHHGKPVPDHWDQAEQSRA